MDLNVTMDFFGGIGHPTNQEGEIIVEGVERAGTPGRETENGRAAESCVSDEKGGGLTQVGFGDRNFGRIDGEACQFVEPR